jgi:hypothetical protein
MLGRVTEFDATHKLACSFRFKRFVERPHRVRIQVVADEDYPLAADAT